MLSIKKQNKKTKKQEALCMYKLLTFSFVCFVCVTLSVLCVLCFVMLDIMHAVCCECVSHVEYV